MLAVAAVISFSLIFPAYNNLRKMKEKLMAVEAELDKKKAECIELKIRLDAIERNPKEIEKTAREKYNMCSDKDTVYVYNPDDLSEKKPPK